MVWNACKLAGQATVSSLSTIYKQTFNPSNFFYMHIKNIPRISEAVIILCTFL